MTASARRHHLREAERLLLDAAAALGRAGVTGMSRRIVDTVARDIGEQVEAVVDEPTVLEAQLRQSLAVVPRRAG